MFSIIIPLFNKAPYLLRAIDSVLRQDFDSWELIVVDNNSTDGGQDIPDRYKNPKIRMVSQPLQGVSYSRNLGVDQAIFPFVTFLDADDEWLPGTLNNFRKLIADYPDAGMYANSYEIVESYGLVRPIRRLPEIPSKGIYPENNLFRTFVHAEMPVHTASVCIRRSVFLELGGFDVRCHQGEDTLLWSKIFLAHKVVLSDFIGAVYHREAGNRSDQYEINDLPVIHEFEKLFADSPSLHPFEKDFREFIAKHLFMSLMANIRSGNLPMARRFLNDPRMKYFAFKTRLAAAAVLCYLPLTISRGLLHLLIRLHLVK